jgi:CRISP-associated protein Cas1
MTTIDTPDAAVPELIPARMINEASYCSRLFYLEWVQSRFVDSTDTVEGRWAHRVVDQPTGRVPVAGVSGGMGRARSVLLSSPRLGLIGKVDLLEGSGSAVVPVDYKHGRPPANPERSWEPERVQVCVLGMILRDNGYECDHGVLWFVESQEQVQVPFTEELEARTLEILAEMKVLAANDVAPPPLVDSPKCPRCSLVGICLPDEHNLLLERSQRPPRRLTPSDGAARPLYVTEPGATIGMRNGRIEIRKREEQLDSVRAIDVSQVCVYGNVQVTTPALRHFFAGETPVCYFSSGGWLQGVATGLPSKHVELRMHQVIVAGSEGLTGAKAIVEGKIRNSRTLLRRNGRPAPSEALTRLANAAGQAAQAESVATLLGVEGAAARTYFAALPTMLRPDLALPGQAFSFSGRNRRPPADAVNCLLSFVYGWLAKDLVGVCIGVGLDPYLGIYHRPRFGRPALALDLAEEFRPLVGDSVVINLVNNGEIKSSHFVVRGEGVALTADGRRSVIASYERRLDTQLTHPVFGYKVTYRRVLEVQARMFAAWLLGEVSMYKPLVTR